MLEIVSAHRPIEHFAKCRVHRSYDRGHVVEAPVDRRQIRSFDIGELRAADDWNGVIVQHGANACPVFPTMLEVPFREGIDVSVEAELGLLSPTLAALCNRVSPLGNLFISS